MVVYEKKIPTFGLEVLFDDVVDCFIVGRDNLACVFPVTKKQRRLVGVNKNLKL